MNNKLCQVRKDTAGSPTLGLNGRRETHSVYRSIRGVLNRFGIHVMQCSHLRPFMHAQSTELNVSYSYMLQHMRTKHAIQYMHATCHAFAI